MRIDLALVLAAQLLGCAAFDRSGAELLAPSSAPPDIRAACRLTARRCSGCHTLDRLDSARDAPAITVRRMRLMPGSGILAADEPVIVRCLAYQEPPP